MTKKAKKINHNTRIVWEGPSLLDGSPIVVLATGWAKPSSNTKTGDMLQVFVFAQSQKPVEAQKAGDDLAVCGGCPHRPVIAKSSGDCGCYVNLAYQSSSWVAWQEGRVLPMSEMDWATLPYRKVRLTAYGDVSAVPWHAIKPFVERGAGHTGYTSNWRNRRYEYLKPYFMASCDTEDARLLAQSRGWKTYTHYPVNDPAYDRDDSVPCPYYDNPVANKCANCLLCDGSSVSVKAIDHGLPWKVRQYQADDAVPAVTGKTACHLG